MGKEEKITHLIETEISESADAKNAESMSRYAETAREVLEKLMPKVLINGIEEPTEISVTFTDNEEIRKINAEHRNIDKATDVLSFPLLDLFDGEGTVEKYEYNPETGGLPLGDIVISAEKIKEQAEEYGHSEKRETAFLICHGLLHLSGYDHTEPEREQVMMALVEKLLDEAGFSRDVC